MSTSQIASSKLPRADAAGIVSWAHIGDIHMVERDAQNHRDLQRIVVELNAVLGETVSFVFLPGDIAEHGAAPEYAIVRESLDALRLPWFAIVGDHDVHEKSLDNFARSITGEPVYRFDVAAYRFFALNTFASNRPDKFDLSAEQLVWLKDGLVNAQQNERASVIFTHCYPSDLGSTGASLRKLIHEGAVKLVEMGHTHYNEISHDGHAVYIATRSTGQIEEGPAGFSITNLDDGVISWRFKPCGEWPLVMITTPADERLIQDPSSPQQLIRHDFAVRIKAWSDQPITRTSLLFDGREYPLRQIADSAVWESDQQFSGLDDGVHRLSVFVADQAGREAKDEIRLLVNKCGRYDLPARKKIDQENALEAWEEHGLLGTQLGPNKNGRKW